MAILGIQWKILYLHWINGEVAEMKEYKIMASSMTGTYTAGRHIANSPAEACEMARIAYRDSSLGRCLKDAGAYHFYVVQKFPYEEESSQ